MPRKLYVISMGHSDETFGHTRVRHDFCYILSRMCCQLASGNANHAFAHLKEGACVRRGNKPK